MTLAPVSLLLLRAEPADLDAQGGLGVEPGAGDADVRASVSKVTGRRNSRMAVSGWPRCAGGLELSQNTSPRAGLGGRSSGGRPGVGVGGRSYVAGCSTIRRVPRKWPTFTIQVRPMRSRAARG